jgi:hypothetical protein
MRYWRARSVMRYDMGGAGELQGEIRSGNHADGSLPQIEARLSCATVEPWCHGQ